jgi:hypothetical protein
MKLAVGALSSLLIAGLYCAQPAQAQGWPQGSYQNAPAQPYGASRYGEGREGYGSSSMNERCFGLHREAEHLRARMNDAWNPIEQGRMEGRLRELREREYHEGCR